MQKQKGILIFVLSILFVIILFFTVYLFDQKDENEFYKEIFSDDTSYNDNFETVSTEYIVTKLSGDIIEISSFESEEQDEVIDEDDSMEEAVLKGIKNLYKGTLINTIYDSGDIMITNYDYNKIAPGENLKMDEATHEMLYKYNVEPNVNINYTDGKLKIECFGNLKKCYIVDDVVVLDLTIVEEYADGIYPMFTNMYIDITKRNFELSDEKINKLKSYGFFKWRGGYEFLENIYEYLEYILYSEKVYNYEAFEVVNINRVFSRNYGHEIWHELPKRLEYTNVKTCSDGIFRIFTMADDFYVNNNIVSTIYTWHDSSASGRIIHNISIDSKKVIDNDELFRLINKDKNEMESIAQSIVLNTIVKRAEHMLNDEDEVVFQRCLEECISGKEVYELNSDFTDDKIEVSDESAEYIISMNIGAYLVEFLNWGNTDFYLNGYGELCFGHDMMDIVSGNSYAFFYNIIDDIRIGDNYILWYSDTDVISREEIEDFTLEELNLAYNEIFARHGHDFKSEGLKKYFNQFFWYNLVENKVVALEDLNEIERENLNIIKAEIDRKK